MVVDVGRHGITCIMSDDIFPDIGNDVLTTVGISVDDPTSGWLGAPYLLPNSVTNPSGSVGTGTTGTTVSTVTGTTPPVTAQMTSSQKVMLAAAVFLLMLGMMENK